MLFKERFAKLGVIFCVLMLVACAKQTRTDTVPVVQKNKYEWQAQKLFAQGRYQQAAILFQRLANKPSVQQNIFRLQAAQALLKAGDHNKAKAYLDLIVVAKLNINQVNQLHLLYAQAYLNLADADQSIKRLQLISFSSLNKLQRRNYYETGASAYALAGQRLKSVQQRIVLDTYLEGALKIENNAAILDELSLVPLESLEVELSRQPSDLYSGWLEMAMITARFAKGTPEIGPALNAWSQQYSGHPGVLLISSGYFVPSNIVLGKINEIAVFLPESGPYRSYAKAIKEGILAAYRRQEQDALQPEIQFYDTQGTAIVPLYQQAIARGAQLIIGPLNKKLVAELAESTDLTVPVLALNYIEGLVKENLYQFALSPLDEVQQAVKQAWSEGHKNAMILAPETAEGERLGNYFQNAWEALTGNVLTVQTFVSGEKDFSAPVKQMLNINESQYRFQKMRAAIGYVQYNPRRRQDVDVIFVVARSSVARLINPQFYHNRAQSVAVYGLSRTYAGRPEPKKDIDLEGMSFCSIPWLFEQAYQGDLDKRALQSIWQGMPDSAMSLVAFGVDAYAVLPYLNELGRVPYSGATGDLWLNEYNRIERHLVCAKFNDGIAHLLDMNEEIAGAQGRTTTRPVSAW
ncbi:MAG: ABC transporter substrate-binding protein [Methyloprofundus sp.]|nr:ABC transporter substrate-binding protein [Methyloprofundus sp.]